MKTKSELVKRMLTNLANQIEYLTEAELSKLESGSHELTMKLTKKKITRNIKQELTDNQMEDILTRLQGCDSREKGIDILADCFVNRNELEQFARYLEVLVFKQDKVEQMRGKIIEATIGAILRSNAIQGKKHDEPR